MQIRYDKKIIKFKSEFEKMCVQYSTTVRSNRPLALNLKIFQEVLPQLHGYFKQDIGDECDPNLEKSVN